MSHQEKRIAQALLEISAVGFRPESPLTFKSGIISPVYVDNRRFPFYPQQWRLVITGFQELLKSEQLEFDILAGIETAGIPHSAALGYALQRPSVFVRKKIKDHGTKSRIEGGSIAGKKVLLIEDLVTTGMSSLAGVQALRQDGAQVDDCLVIVSYGFAEASAAFAQAQVHLHTLTQFPIILEEALRLQKITSAQKVLIDDWFADPWGWAERHGFGKSERQK